MDRVKILNFVTDEKFIDGVINQNNTITDEEHDYVIFRSKKFSQLQYIRNADKILQLSSSKVKDKFREKKYNAIFLHSLYAIPIDFYQFLPKNIPIFWFSWGHDIYQFPSYQPLIPIKLYQEITKNVINTIYNRNKLIRAIFALPKRMINGIKDIKIKKVLKSITYHSGVVPYETQLLKKYNPSFHAESVIFNYLDPLQKIHYDPYEGKDILIGNSGAPTNNHLDLLPIIETLKLDDRKIFVPLNYGGPDKYINEVKRNYREKLEARFYPITTFMEKEEYFKMIKSCSILIFNIERQQAMGNIHHGFRSGQKIFLSETSLLFSYLRERGYIIFSIQSDLPQKDSLNPLTDEEKIHNYNISLEDFQNWISNREYLRRKIVEYKENL